jgi:hypothetical protein
MYRIITLISFSILFLFNHSLEVYAQEEIPLKELNIFILKDGLEVVGYIEKEDSVTIQVRTPSDIVMQIPLEAVEEIRAFTGEPYLHQSKFRDPNSTRLLFAPTARSLKSGNGYFSAYELFFPFFAVGVADFLTFAGGISLIPGAQNQAIYLAPKVTPLQSEMYGVSVGALYINALSSRSEGLGIVYGVGTYGESDKAVTLGLGWGFSGEDFSNKPIIMIGGELQVSNSIKLITENWIPPDSDIAIIGFGIRFFGQKLAADIGLLYPAGGNMKGFPFIPWLGFAYNF